MDDIERPDLYLFTEDAEAGELMKELLRFSSIDVSRIMFMEAGSCEVIKVLGRLSKSSSLPVKSFGVLDADQAESDGCIRLPGTMAPEKQVFADILANGVGFLAQRLELSNASVTDALTRARTLTDHHAWVSESAKHLGNQSNSYLWTSMCQVWVRHCIQQPDRDLIAKCVSRLLK